ncbi:formate dehydrogenase accessory protein FdhE [Rahnella sp. SAP-1]|uniref:Protein FdhE homolog n=1 Tax=Rouxiella aceris TaxID=2703884 RepID=A0A848MLX9_9GAMM|nr:formate dehydrogenase accessory protein FdhE [Rouxiella aceris]NMP29417.1 formate dehydrogenase accessory protein FdhE [Rouxiella aceris]
MITPPSASQNGPIPYVLRSAPLTRYTGRAARLRGLAANASMADYLLFSAALVEAQQAFCERFPLPAALAEQAAASASLKGTAWLDSEYWQQALDAILDQMLTTAPDHVRPAARALRDSTRADRQRWASELLNGQFQQVSATDSLFIWAAISLYWTQLAAATTVLPSADYGQSRQLCPLCGSPPVASVIHAREPRGLRYLHCSLCECQWHKVRSTCSVCPQDEKVEYWSIDKSNAVVKAESCDTCHSYLKALYAEQDSEVDAMADSLASLLLDMEMETRGYRCSGINPLLLPGAQE